ncbi:MAG: HipA domain-containing protein [Methylocystis sp.]|nr:HipA domain-containing protein [Methylocystis sp.]MBI3275578.1 HipA domain-containing protein [Methylocystis sp.]
MAAALWGKVYYDTSFAGELRQEPGGRCVFTYDATYLEAKQPAIAYTLPKQSAPHICEQGLHPFFDNLIAEGWLRNAQARALKTDPNNHFALLLAFGRDCAGAVSVIDPAPDREPVIDIDDPVAAKALGSRGSLSGVQRKLLAVKEGRIYRPARHDETSQFIAKLPSGSLRDIVENEFLTTIVARALLPDDQTVDAVIAPLRGLQDRALLVRRFDRLPSGAKIHFEEFNQLLGRRSGDDKYDAAYEDMAAFIRTTPGCAPVDAWRLYRRILVCFLTGNTDAHLKNFAMLHVQGGLQLTPAYDLVAATLYPEYRTLALSIAKAENLSLERLRPKHLSALGDACGLDAATIAETVRKLDQRRKAAEKAVVANARKIGAAALGDNLVDLMERRWNGTFSSIGRFLSTKRSAADGE